MNGEDSGWGLDSGLTSRAPAAQRNVQQPYHGNVGLENLLYELVPGRVDQLDDVTMQGVPVLLQEAWQQQREVMAPPARAPQTHNI